MSNSDFEELAPFESALFLIEQTEETYLMLDRGDEIERLMQGHEVIKRPVVPTLKSRLILRLNGHVSQRVRYKATQAFSETRSALDYAFNDAASLLGYKKGNPLSFPVARTQEDLEREIGRRCNGVHPALLDFIRNLEPREDGKGQLIWLLSKVAGKGKHRKPVSLRPSVKWMFIEDGVEHTCEGLMPKANQNCEIELGIGDVRDGQGVHVRLELDLDISEFKLSNSLSVPFSSIFEVAKNTVRELQAETERLSRNRELS